MILEKIKLRYDKESPWVRPGRVWQKWYPAEVPKTIDYPNIPVYQVLDEVAEELPNNVAINFVFKDRKYTYKEFYENANSVANGLHNLGVGKGDAVAIMTANVPEYFFSQFGILKTGAGVVPINSLLRKKEVTHIIQDSKIIRAIIVQDHLVSVAKAAAGSDIEIIVVGETSENTSSFNDLLTSNSKSLQFNPPKINPKQDLAALLYTGGTTGLPKGVFLTHYNSLCNILQAFYLREDEAELSSRRGKSASIQILPVCHSFGYATSLLSIYAGSMILLYDRFDPEDVLRNIESFGIQYFAGVVTMYKMLLTRSDLSNYNLSSIKVLLCGGGPLPFELAKAFKERTGLTAVQGFGLTECVAAATLSPPWIRKNPKSVGIPIIDTDVKIVNPETLEELNPGTAGELLIRGPQVMREYFNKPEATAKVLVEDKEGNIWLRTGDIGMMDEDGLFYIVGRTKEMIKYKEYRILPREVEETLFEHPAVLDCAVIGIPDEFTGENIKAYIVLRKEFKGKITEDEIIAWAKEKIAAYKYPRYIKFIRSLPKTAVGKIDRRKLQEIKKPKE